MRGLVWVRSEVMWETEIWSHGLLDYYVWRIVDRFNCALC